MSEAQRGLEGLTNSANILQEAAKRVAEAFAVWKIADWAKDTALLSARYETLGIAMNTAGLNAGFSAAQMSALQKSMEDTGISMVVARQSLVMMAAAQMDLGKSSELARVAQNVAVVANMNSSEAFETLTRSIQTGQAIIAHHMGLMVNYAGAEEKLAKAIGKTKDQLTDSEKVQARMNEVMRVGAGYQGLYESSMTTAGKQLKSMERYVENLRVKIGELFQPALSAGVEFFTAALKDLAAWMDKASKSGDLQKIAGAIGSFTSGGLEAAVAPIKMMIEYSKQLKEATLAIGAAALFAYGNQWIPAIASAIAPTLRAITLVASMELATINYATSTGVAALAMAGFRAAMTALLSPMGLVAAGLAVLYFSTKGIREETERLNDAIARQERFITQVQNPILKLKSDAQSLEKQRAALLADGGTPGVHTHQFQVEELVKTTTEGMGNIPHEWAESARMYAERVVTARDALESTKTTLLKQQEAMEAAAKSAQAYAEAQAKARDQITQTLGRHMTEGTAITALEHEQLDILAKKVGLQKVSYDMAEAMVKLPTREKTVPSDILGGPKSTRDSLNFELVQSEEALRLADLKLRAQTGETWAIIGQTVVETSSYASDAIVRWSNNLDGLGVSWRTLGDTVRNVLADMIRQMEKVILQQQLMDPLLKWAGIAIGGISQPAAPSSGGVWFGGGSTSGLGGGGAGGYTGALFIAPPPSGGPPSGGNQTSIVVNVNTSTGETSSKSKAQGASDLGRQIEDAVNAVIIKNQRQGGLLARTA
jgi:hypothetical protein